VIGTQHQPLLAVGGAGPRLARGAQRAPPELAQLATLVIAVQVEFESNF
jgi:hypothetical protein